MITKELKGTKAITLIAMVISILVLLILAGVSLSLVVGETGITQRAVIAKKTYDIAGAKEKLELQIAGYAGDFYQDKYINGNIGDSQTVGDYVLGKFTNGSDFEGDYTLTKDGNEITITNKKDASQSAIATIDDNGKVSWSGTVTEAVAIWTQDGTSVTNGEVTLTVGQAVTGYSVDVETNDTIQTISNWYVLGAEDGKMLITTNNCTVETTLEGKDGYTNGVTFLTQKAEEYTNTNFADGQARPMNISDINRIMGYNPDVTKFNAGTENISQWNNEVTYTLKNGKIYYKGTKYPQYLENEIGTESSETSLEYRDIEKNQWIKFGLGDNPIYSATIKNSYYEPSNILESNSDAYKLLFDNTLPWQSPYLLGSNCVECKEGYIYYGLYMMIYNGVGNCYMFVSNGCVDGGYNTFRPVVTLLSNIIVTQDGEISK